MDSIEKNEQQELQGDNMEDLNINIMESIPNIMWKWDGNSDFLMWASNDVIYWIDDDYANEKFDGNYAQGYTECQSIPASPTIFTAKMIDKTYGVKDTFSGPLFCRVKGGGWYKFKDFMYDNVNDNIEEFDEWAKGKTLWWTGWSVNNSLCHPIDYKCQSSSTMFRSRAGYHRYNFPCQPQILKTSNHWVEYDAKAAQYYRELYKIKKCGDKCADSAGEHFDKTMSEAMGAKLKPFDVVDDVNVETILEEAARITSKDRNKDYGHPSEDMVRIAKMWSVILRGEVLPEDVPLCMIAVKMSRQINKHKRDNLVDICGYARLLEMMDEGDSECAQS